MLLHNQFTCNLASMTTPSSLVSCVLSYSVSFSSLVLGCSFNLKLRAQYNTKANCSLASLPRPWTPQLKLYSIHKLWMQIICILGYCTSIQNLQQVICKDSKNNSSKQLPCGIPLATTPASKKATIKISCLPLSSSWFFLILVRQVICLLFIFPFVN